jgi:predicted RNA polymerase sigma factor
MWGEKFILVVDPARADRRSDNQPSHKETIDEGHDVRADDRGLAALARANDLVAAQGAAAGPYQLQAAIAAHHARAATAEATEWPRIAALYALLAQRAASPIVELNRAVAVAMAFCPDAGLELVDALVAGGALGPCHLLPAVRGDLLAKRGRGDEATAEFRRAAELTRNERERDVLLARARDSAVSASRSS